MKRIEFVLTMPGRASWNGKWSGQDKHHALVMILPDDVAEKVISHQPWTHRWEDGWCANISARVMEKGERKRKSSGFNGYDWMVRNIISHGSPYHDKE